MPDIEHLIRERAYQLWRQAGCPPGRSEEFWFAAQRALEGNNIPRGDRPAGAIEPGPLKAQADTGPPEQPAPAATHNKPPRSGPSGSAPASRGGRRRPPAT